MNDCSYGMRCHECILPALPPPPVLVPVLVLVLVLAPVPVLGSVPVPGHELLHGRKTILLIGVERDIFC